MIDLVIVGRGRVGKTIARRAKERGLDVRLVAGRAARLDPRVLASRALWITVPDPHVPEVAARIARALATSASRTRPAIAHASGSLSPDVLAPCRAAGAPVASVHPIVSFGTTDTDVLGATFLLAGDVRATRAFATLTRKLGARALVRPLHGPRYHAALALLANGAAALADRATSILTSGDPSLSPIEAQRALGRLLRSVADNVERVGATRALTGPIVRGDVKAIERHLASLSADERADYVSVSRSILRAAEASGLSSRDAHGVATALDAVSASRGRRAGRRSSPR